MTRSVVLLSGGIDSAVALAWAIREGHDVEALTFNYHDRPAAEVEATASLALAAGVPLRVVEAPFLREAGDLPPGTSSHLEGVPEGYVPARNLVFYSVAANVAESIGASSIVGGHHGADADVFPDAGDEFFRLFTEAARRGSWSAEGRRVRVLRPLSTLTKEGVLKLGLELGVPLGLTWSCSWNAPVSCGRCRSCRERLGAFAAAGTKDPIAYASTP